MNTEILKGNWKELKGKIQQKWAKFTDDDVTSLKGNASEFVGKLQKLYGYSKERAEEEVKNFRQKYNELFGDASEKSDMASSSQKESTSTTDDISADTVYGEEHRTHGFSQETAQPDSSPMTGKRSARDQGSPNRDMDSDVSGFSHASSADSEETISETTRSFGDESLDEDKTEINQSSSRAKRTGASDDVERGVIH